MSAPRIDESRYEPVDVARAASTMMLTIGVRYRCGSWLLFNGGPCLAKIRCKP